MPHTSKGGVSAAAGRASAAKGCSTCITEEQQSTLNTPTPPAIGESDFNAEAGGSSSKRTAGANARPGRLQYDAHLRDECATTMLGILAEEMTGPVLPPPPEGAGS